MNCRRHITPRCKTKILFPHWASIINWSKRSHDTETVVY